MSEMMHSGGPELSPLGGFECTVGDSVVISRPHNVAKHFDDIIATHPRLDLYPASFTLSTPSSMGRSNGTGLMLRCAASSNPAQVMGVSCGDLGGMILASNH
jgi:hypothetical protein